MVKLLLGRGPRRSAPAYQIFDAYQMRWLRGRLPFGNAHPLQRFKRRAIEKKMRGAILQAAARSVPPGAPEIEQILDLARWAPSGDNSQPWRFEIKGEDALRVHIALDDNVYEFDRARPTLLSAGMLLETLRLAASRKGRMVWWELKTETATALTIDVGLPKAPGAEPDPLADLLDRSRAVLLELFEDGSIDGVYFFHNSQRYWLIFIEVSVFQDNYRRILSIFTTNLLPQWKRATNTICWAAGGDTSKPWARAMASTSASPWGWGAA